MIIVKGRELLIPENERYLGTNYDTGMENRVFRIPRLSQSGTDLSDLVFKVNLIYDGAFLSWASLQKIVGDDYIYLTWTVVEEQVSVTGTVFVCVTGNDTNDTVKWSSFAAPFYTEKSLGGDIESEFRTAIKDISGLKASVGELKETDSGLSQSIESEASSRKLADEDLENQIAAVRSAVGTPAVAQTIAAMTDRSKIYVYTGSEGGYIAGHWYYWNGSAWTDGGVYNSEAIETDKTLTLIDMAADAKATGRLKERFNDYGVTPLRNCIIATHPGFFYNNSGVLTENSNYNAIEVKVDGGKTYSFKYDYYFQDNFCSILDVSGNIIGKLTSSYKHTSGNIIYATMPSNADTLRLSCGARWCDTMVILEGLHDLTNVSQVDYPLWATKELYFNDNGELLVSGAALANCGLEQVVNYLDPANWDYGHYWSSTTSVANNGYTNIKIENIPAGTYYFNACAAPFTYFHDKVTNTIYRGSTQMGLSDSAGPVQSVTMSNRFDLYLTVAGNTNQAARLSKVYFSTRPIGDGYYTGKKVGFSVDNVDVYQRIFYCGSTRQYKKLKDAIEAAEEWFDSIVYVDGETFDLVSEYGQEYLDNYSTSAPFGLVLKNRIHLIFGAGNKVLFNYTGSNAVVHEYFSPFNTGEYGCTVEGANVESTNCRYSLHDERSGGSEYYHNHFIDCSFVHDSAATSWGAHMSVAGGFGFHGDIVFRDCQFKSVGTSGDLYYHNHYSDNSLSKITLENCYMNGSAFISNHGTSTKKSIMYVLGGSYGVMPFKSIDSSKPDNVDIVLSGVTVREQSLTLDSSIITDYGCKVGCTGEVVGIVFQAALVNAPTAGTTYILGSFPAALAPKDNKTIPAYNDSGALIGVVNVTSGGGVQYRAVTTTKYLTNFGYSWLRK